MRDMIDGSFFEARAPIVLGIADGDSITITCPHCNEEHTHGRNEPTHAGLFVHGHRHGHCLSKGRGQNFDYNIVEWVA